MRRCIAVLDLGKTNIKLALVEAGTLRELAVRRQANIVRPGPPYAHFDTEAQWAFFAAALRELGAEHEIEAISITAHGATGALLRADGRLALPVLDYEHEIPAEAAAAYDAVRPDFAETGSPRLPCGLNLGAQLHWQLSAFAEARDAAPFVTWLQYWAHRLTGVAAVEPTSVGCHTDLWNSWRRELSSLVRAMDLEPMFPPLRPATDVLGGLTASAAAEVGLPAGLPVHCGIHDSNASLYPHLAGRDGPFSVVSTGTWVVCMSVGGAADALDAARDTLVNTDAAGDPVPSARFMGGRGLGPVPGPERRMDRGAGRRRRAHARPVVVSGLDDRHLPGADRRARAGDRRGPLRGQCRLSGNAGRRVRARGAREGRPSRVPTRGCAPTLWRGGRRRRRRRGRLDAPAPESARPLRRESRSCCRKRA